MGKTWNDQKMAIHQIQKMIKNGEMRNAQNMKMNKIKLRFAIKKGGVWFRP